MQKADYKFYFDKNDAELLKISPRKDIMLLHVIASIIPVVWFWLGHALRYTSSLLVRYSFLSVLSGGISGKLFKSCTANAQSLC